MCNCGPAPTVAEINKSLCSNPSWERAKSLNNLATIDWGSIVINYVSINGLENAIYFLSTISPPSEAITSYEIKV